MALTEETFVDQVTALPDGQLQVRTAIVIKRDGEEVSRSFHRKVVVPGDDLTPEDSQVKTIGEALHTEEVIAAFKAAQAAKERQIGVDI